MPKKILSEVHRLMRMGYSESSAYAMATSGYKNCNRSAIGVVARKKSENDLSEVKNLLLLLDNNLRHGKFG